MKEIEAWAARDFNGVLCMYPKKPVKMSEKWSHFYNLDFFILDDRLFPEIKWTDDEPTKVKIVIDK